MTDNKFIKNVVLTAMMFVSSVSMGMSDKDICSNNGYRTHDSKSAYFSIGEEYYINSTLFVKYNKQQFVFRSKIEVPKDNPVVQKALSEKLFGNGCSMLADAYGKYISGVDKVVATMPRQLNEYNFVTIGSCYEGTFYDGMFTTYLYYVTRTINKEVENPDSYLLKETRGYVTYSAKSQKILTVADVLSPEVIKKNMLDGTSTNIQMVNESVLICHTTSNTKTSEAKRFLLTKDNMSSFTEYIKKIIMERDKDEEAIKGEINETGEPQIMRAKEIYKQPANE